MPTEILTAIIGFLASVIAAWIQSRNNPNQTDSDGQFKKSKALAVFAIGIAFTSLVVSLVSFKQAFTPEIKVVSEMITVYAPGTDLSGVDKNRTMKRYVAGVDRDPTQNKTINIVDLKCSQGMKPIGAWYAINRSRPGDLLYNIFVAPKHDNIELTLRVAQGSRGYAYVQIFALCSKFEK
ncbi:hypothetical protein [Agaribacter marinus]|uniref:Uncharacterized protein n=1 Tax=Agaribacter marinus TaxID=1431249 RepID=A0AA37WI23_9ALTE|nr:hypothetical protein [Agaribacter marinus]GLR71641.1 hypothetical protein GCM10007852_25490 [Agaribacter marinus]